MNESLILIALCAVSTYALRLGGLLLADKLPGKGRTRRMLDALPASILISYVTPEIFKAGPKGMVAALATGIITLMTKNILLASFIGVIVLIILRELI